MCLRPSVLTGWSGAGVVVSIVSLLTMSWVSVRANASSAHLGHPADSGCRAVAGQPGCFVEVPHGGVPLVAGGVAALPVAERADARPVCAADGPQSAAHPAAVVATGTWPEPGGDHLAVLQRAALYSAG